MPPPSTLLALESATARLSVALFRDGHVARDEHADCGMEHAERLLPMIDAVLGAEGLGPDAIGAWAISIGPGSFTSLRVGLATLKGLAFESDRPVVAVPTLEAMAWAAFGGLPDREAPVAALLDARRGELYAAAFRAGGEAGTTLEAVVPEGLYTPAELGARLPAGSWLVGEGAVLLGDAVVAAGPADLRVAGPEIGAPSAVAVGERALETLERGVSHDLAGLIPRYLRRAQAEADRVGSAVELAPVAPTRKLD